MDINLKTLIGKLNDTTRAAATRAAGICVGFGQYEVDIEHLFLALLEQPASDVVVAARAAGIPTVTVTETLSPASASFQQWQVAQLTRLQAALHQATGR